MTKVKSATGTMARYGLVGWPIEHSRSPELHNGWFAKHGLAAEYEKYPVAPEEVEGWCLPSRRDEFDGLNVTMPHKNMAAQLAKESSDWVQVLQAANTLIRLPSGGWRAENTDAPGFAEVVRSFIRRRNFSCAQDCGVWGRRNGFGAGGWRVWRCWAYLKFLLWLVWGGKPNV